MENSITSLEELQKLVRTIKDLKQSGVVILISFLFNSPIWPVQKTGGSRRMTGTIKISVREWLYCSFCTRRGGLISLSPLLYMICSEGPTKHPFLSTCLLGRPETVCFNLTRPEAYLYSFASKTYYLSCPVLWLVRKDLHYLSLQHNNTLVYYIDDIRLLVPSEKEKETALDSLVTNMHIRMANKSHQNLRAFYLSEILRGPVRHIEIFFLR